jgi:hypothetical protein
VWAANIRAASHSDKEVEAGSRLDIGRKLFGELPERIWINDIE